MNRRLVIATIIASAAATTATASEYRQVFKRPASEVYAALLRALPDLGYKVKSQNDELMRVNLSAGMSGFSFGENMTVAVVDDGTDRSSLEVGGELKMSSNILARGRVMKHFNTIVDAVSAQLKASAPQPLSPPGG
jgi:hypothetical protein